MGEQHHQSSEDEMAHSYPDVSKLVPQKVSEEALHPIAAVEAPDESEIRRLLDPEHTLPEVELVYKGESADDPDERNYEIVLGGMIVGDAKIGTMVEDGSSLCFTSIGLDPDYPDFKSRSVGMAAYVKAIELAHAEGRAFTNHGLLSEDSMQMWERLRSKGVVTVLDPMEKVAPDTYTGMYSIDPPEHL